MPSWEKEYKQCNWQNFKIKGVDEELHKSICLLYKNMSSGFYGFYIDYQDRKGFTEKKNENQKQKEYN